MATEHEDGGQAATFAAFRKAAEAAWDDVAVGRFTDVADEDLDAFVAELSMSGQRSVGSS